MPLSCLFSLSFNYMTQDLGCQFTRCSWRDGTVRLVTSSRIGNLLSISFDRGVMSLIITVGKRARRGATDGDYRYSRSPRRG